MRSLATLQGRTQQRGATMVEYALLLFVVLVVAAGLFRVMGQKVGGGAANASAELR